MADGERYTDAQRLAALDLFWKFERVSRGAIGESQGREMEADWTEWLFEDGEGECFTAYGETLAEAADYLLDWSEKEPNLLPACSQEWAPAGDAL